jgi:hypothetical protein
MRTVLIGSDFMYDNDGNLKPIEINTAVGWDGAEKIEVDADCLDLTSLYDFVETNGFTSIHYVGDLGMLNKALENQYTGSSIVYEFHGVGKNAITIPFIEDNDETLIIRSAYDTTALVDDTYCRDKIEFMKLIESQSFGSQFAYKDDNDNVVSNITIIPDNGEHPNFIVKSRYPEYDKDTYPKFFKVENQTQLDEVIAAEVTSDYFIMENYCNTTNNFEGHIKVIRSLNILYPPTLESIQIGQYTKLNQNVFFTGVIYDSETYEVASEYRDSYVTTVNNRWLPKLLDTDLVEMADGTFKTALELEVNDLIKTIDIPNPNGTDNSSYTTNFGITYETLVSGTTYSTNKVTNLRRINLLSYINQLTFDDDSTWEDTGVSSYLIERNNEVQFENLFDVQIGDVVLLLNTTEGQVDFVRKTVTSNIQIKKVFSGWFISVENAHLFLTKTSSTNNESFVSIEHNGPSCPPYGCPCPGTCSSCPKAEPYCAYPGPYCRANSYSGFCM